MRYLKLTVERNRRRIEVEQLLLLLLRIALLVLLFFFLARPVLNPTGLERWLGTAGRASQVVLIDDSLSMGYAAGGGAEEAAFARAKELATALLAAARPQDRCTLLTTSAPRVPVLHEVEATRRDELSAAVAALPLGATHAAWTSVLAGVDEVVRSCTYPTRQLTIVTDLRKAGWEDGVASIARRWGEGGRGGPGAGRGRRRRGDRQRRAPGARPARSDRPRRGGEPLGGDDPQRLVADAGRGQGGPEGRRPADRGAAPRDPPARDRPGAADRHVPGTRGARPLAGAPRGRAAGRQSPLGRGPGEGRAADPPGGRRAVVGAVRVGGRLPGRAPVDRHRLGGGVAGRGRPRPGLPLAPARPRRRARAGERRRARARAGQRASASSSAAGWG